MNRARTTALIATPLTLITGTVIGLSTLDDTNTPDTEDTSASSTTKSPAPDGWTRDQADRTTTPPSSYSRPPVSTTPPVAPADPTSKRGNVIAEIGQSGEITGTDGETLLTFTIESIDTDPTCTDAYYKYGSHKPENGHLISVQLNVQTAQLDSDYMSISGSDFSYVDPAGTTHTEVYTIATYSCLDEPDQFTRDSLSSGSNYTGTIVLDVTQPAGTLVFEPYWITSTGGWEVTF